ncbi:MAG TPA: PH domain-containing protein [Planctomycetota bacterium]|nr:PH domain-containing protein [Planctomycetota bacterium]
MPDDAAKARTPAWSGHPSQWLNWKHWLISLVLIAAMIWGWMESEALVGALRSISLPESILGWIALVVLGLIVLNLLVRFVLVRSTGYRVIDGVLQIESGVLSRRTDMLELFRVRDIVEERPLIMRLVGIGNVTLMSSDTSTPRLTLAGVPGSTDLVHVLREEVNRARGRVRVFEGGDVPPA